MQPCGVCGRTGVDDAGYCTHCRTYVGQSYGLVSGPGAYAAAAPESAPPYGHTSGAPYQTGYPQPAYPPPAYPQQQPQPPQRGRSPFMIPLIALSVVLVVLVVAIVAVVVVKASDSGEGTDDVAVDDCVVGSWRVTSHRESVVVDGGSSVQFSGSGATVRLSADGKGVTDYGDGTTFFASVAGIRVELVFKGTISYDFATSNGSITFSNVQADGTATLYQGGVEATSQPLNSDTTPSKYTCEGDKLVQNTELADIEMARQ